MRLEIQIEIGIAGLGDKRNYNERHQEVKIDFHQKEYN